MATEYKLSYTASEIDKKLGQIDNLAAKDEIPTKTSQLTNDSGFITGYSETDPTVPSWAKQASKPSYTASEVGALPSTTKIPSKTSDLTNDSGYITGYTETDPTVPAWAKNATKPSYSKGEVGLGNVDNVKQYSASNPPPYPVTSVNNKTGAVTLNASDVGARPSSWTPSYSDVGAEKSGTAAAAVSSHNTNTNAHNDIRLLVDGLSSRINALANSTDEDLDQMAEIVAYIKNNKTLIDNVTTSKVNVADIINNLTTNVSNKPLSAAQGVALKALIDALENDKLDASALSTAISTALAQAKTSGEFDGEDGVSATHKWNGTVLTVTSASGTSSADLKGNKGDSGVYMGSVEPTDPNVVVWVNPDGEAEISEAAKNLKRHAASPQRPQTVIVNNVQDSTTYKGSGIVADTENKILWDKSVHVSGAGSYIRFHKNYSPFSIDMKNNLLVVGIKINSIATNATLDVRVADASGVLIPYNLMVSGSTTVYGEWQEFTIPMGGYHRENSNNNPANVDFSNIVDIYIISVNGACDFNVQYIGYRPNPLHKGIISFTFDDGYKSAADGIKALAERGATGTLYVMGEMGGSTFLTTSELQNLVQLYGTDVEAHGGTEYQNLTDDELIEHWISIKKYLIENGLSNGDHLAYPGGMHPARVQNLAKRYFQSCRTIKSNIPVESYPPYDSHAIRAVTGVSQNAVKPSKVKQLIDQAIISKSWLILVLHKIDDGTDTTSMSCSMEAFKEIVDYAVASDIRIMNVAEVFETNGQSVSVAELTQSVIDALPVYNGEVS